MRAHAELLIKSLERKAGSRAVRDGARVVSDEEVRDMARSFFDRELLDTVASRLG